MQHDTQTHTQHAAEGMVGIDEYEEPAPLLILMADSQPLFDGADVPAALEAASWMQVAAAMNFQYAKRHNYKFVRYTYPADNCTAHQQHHPVRRHPSWCKLLAIKHAARLVQNGGFVFWIDSDAMFFDHSLDFASFLQGVGFEVDGKHVEPREAVRLRSEAPLFAFNNAPWPSESPLCAGVQAWRIPLSDQLLSQWWVTEGNDDPDKWEQSALKQIYPEWKYRIGVFNITAFPHCIPPEGSGRHDPFFESQYIRHFTSELCQRQIEILGLATHIGSSNFGTILQELKANHSAVLSNDDMYTAAQTLERN